MAAGDFAVFINDQGGDAENLVLAGQLFLAVHVYLGHLQFGVLLCQTVNDGGDLSLQGEDLLWERADRRGRTSWRRSPEPRAFRTAGSPAQSSLS